MSKQLLFTRQRSSPKKIHSFINSRDLNCLYRTRNEIVWENEDMLVNANKYVLRILVYDGKNTFLINNIKKYFYGDIYEK